MSRRLGWWIIGLLAVLWFVAAVVIFSAADASGCADNTVETC